MRMTEYGVNVPDGLLKQLEEEQVVLFLGAGISKLSPSNLPDFTKLTRDICKEANVPFSKNLSLDYNLSKVAKTGSGYDVHQRVIEKINPPNSKPNEWHETLLRWFGCANKVRIVTTNFDTHLSTAADNLEWSMPQYIAPVLPLGDDFQGIVYLHGRIDKKESIIVTGEDFGKAYLNYAWAARFLQAMFAKYTVIFIGYSNRDPLVRYLTSGLSVCTTNKHYAFTGSDAVLDWSELDIEPVLFEQSKERFTAMLHVAKDIAQQYCMTELEHKLRMRDFLTTKDILLSPQDQDYLLRSLTKANRVKHFCQYATGEKWLRWSIKHIKEVQLLFDPFVKSEQSSRDYVEWIGGQCFEMANDLLLQEMVKLRLGSSLWLEISLVICYREINITAERMTSWIYILLRDAVFPSHWEVLQNILLNNKFLTNGKTRWVIFSQLLKPIMQLNKSIIIESELSERPVIAALAIRSNDPQELCEYWQKVLQSQLPDIHDQVQSLVTLYLTEAYYMLIEQGGWSPEFDEVSCSRKTIVKEIDDSGYTHFEPMDPLLDAAVDLIQWYSAHKQEYLNWLITSWIDTNIPMLKRLSLYAVSYASWNDEEKYQWLINNKVLEWRVYYTESYQLLSSIFINLSSVTKEDAIRVLLQMISQYVNEGNLSHNRGIRTYYLLNTIIEKNGETKYLVAAMRTINKLLKDAGIEYQAADLAKQPVVTDVSVLLSGSIITALQWYDEIVEQDSFFNENKEIFENAFSEKAKEELDWGISLIDILWQQDNKNAYYLIGGLLRVLGDAELTLEQQLIIYQKIKRASKIENLIHDVTCFLKSRSRKGLDGYSHQLLDELLDCVAYVLDWAVDVPFEKEPRRQRLDAVINHPIGDLTFVLLQVLSDHGKVEKYINASTEQLSSLLSYSNVAAIVEVICASQFHFLYAIAPDWATTKILPLFDWNKAKEQAERAWDGFLFSGRFTRNLIRPLLRHFVATVDYLEVIDGERYCEYLAWITMSRYIEKPLALKALGSVMFKLNDQQRGRYFNYIRSRLSEVKDQHYSRWAWNNVLLPLLKARKHMTVELGSGELMAILGWILEFKDYCVALMEQLVRFSTVKIKECYQLNRFEKTDLCDKHAEETTKLWIWLADSLTPGEFSNGIYGKFAERLLANEKVSLKGKQQLAEALSELGISS